MASLKEIKNRIGSVRSTLKITSAMKLVASAKLRKAQQAVAAALPYQQTLSEVLSTLLADYAAKHREGKNAGAAPWEAFSRESDGGRVAIVAVSSNSSLCGGFNANAIRGTLAALSDAPDATVFSIGRKMADAMKKAGHPSPVMPSDSEGISSTAQDFSRLAEHPSYDGAAALAEELIKGFLERRYSRVELIYNHFASTASQPTVRETLLPFSGAPVMPSDSSPVMPSDSSPVMPSNSEGISSTSGDTLGLRPRYDNAVDCLVEPSSGELIEELLPKVLKFKLYSVLLDSAAAEHAARTVAMQMATDNAEDLLRDLTLEYNKSRQQKITAEILDLVGGSLL